MAKDATVSPALAALMTSLMTDASKADSKLPLKDKLSILDRGLKLEAIKAKLKDDEFGRDFDNPPGEGQDDDV